MDDHLMQRLIQEEISRRRLLKSLGLGGAAVLSIPALVAGFGGTSSSARAQAMGTDAEIDVVNWGTFGSSRTLFLPNNASIPAIILTANLMESLLQIDDAGTLQPSLAESWNQPDPLTYIYQIRKGVKFWDGSELTPEDVIFSLNYEIDPKYASQMNSYFTGVESVTQTDDMEITIKLNEPEATFRWIPGTYFAQIFQKKFYDAHTDDIGTAGVLVMGTGPYKPVELIPDTSLTIERFDDYWGAKPTAKKLVIKSIVEDSTRLVAMRSGELDGVGTFSVPVDQAKNWQSIDGVNVAFTSSLQLGTFAFNCGKEPWSDVHVRRACAHAVDREGLIKNVWGGHAAVAVAMPPPADWRGWLDDSDVAQRYSKIPRYEFDLDKAKAELEQSAFANGFSGVLVYDENFPQLAKAALNLSQNMAKLGGKIEVKQVTGDDWFSIISGPKDDSLNVTAGQLGTDYNDPGENIYLNFQSKFAVNGAYNFANFKNADVDKLLDEQLALPAQSPKRADKIFEVLNLLATEMPQLYLWWNDTAMAINEKYVFEGFNPWTWVQPWATRIKLAG
jgi:peptide/nickel transport system substrate-binding protein